jgi:hypothetical protein
MPLLAWYVTNNCHFRKVFDVSANIPSKPAFTFHRYFIPIHRKFSLLYQKL